MRRTVREKLMSSVPESELTTMTFKIKGGKVIDPNFKWEKHDEFSYKGEMYDVVRMETLENEIRLRCFGDKKETSLIALLKRKIKNDVEHSSSKSPTGQVLAKILAMVYLPTEGYALRQFDTQKLIPIYLQGSHSIIYTFVDTPPPKYLA